MPNNEDTEMVSCISCSTEYEVDDIYRTDSGDPVCNDCQRTCERCDWVGSEGDDWNYVDGNQWCASCWENWAFYCDHCDSTYDTNTTSSYTVIGRGDWCEHCTSDYATYCDTCDEYYGDDNSNCPACYEDEPSGKIHSYHYKPEAQFNGSSSTNLFMGFELEMGFPTMTDSAMYRQAVSKVERLEDSGVCYLKSDSSIGYNAGFELVTHPHTLGAYEQATGLWNYIEELRTTYGARSWDTDSCGLHVHVSRAAFKSGAHTHRFLAMVYRNPAPMMKLAGRKNSRYARFNDVYVQDEWGIPRFNLKDKIHQGHRTERYSAVNTGNENTLELRFFRGNMKRAGVMVALELTHALVEYTRDLSVADAKLGMLQWDWFADWVAVNNGMYPNLYAKMNKLNQVSLDNREMINA